MRYLDLHLLSGRHGSEEAARPGLGLHIRPIGPEVRPSDQPTPAPRQSHVRLQCRSCCSSVEVGLLPVPWLTFPARLLGQLPSVQGLAWVEGGRPLPCPPCSPRLGLWKGGGWRPARATARR